MNKDRRTRLRDLAAQVDDIITEMECIRDEEQEAFDNMPEGLQCSDRGSKMEEYIDEIDDVIGVAQELYNTIAEIVE